MSYNSKKINTVTFKIDRKVEIPYYKNKNVGVNFSGIPHPHPIQIITYTLTSCQTNRPNKKEAKKTPAGDFAMSHNIHFTT